MRLLKKIFSKNSQKQRDLPVSNINWVMVKSVAQIENIKKRSKQTPCLIFKHSTRCGISKMVLKMFEKKWADTKNVDFYFLDLLRYRDVSDAIAQEFEVIHQSPQILILNDGVATAHASHYKLLSIDV